MRILITRPWEDAERLAELLRQRRYEPIISPLMEIRFLDGPEIPLDGVQAILATSANGVRALERRTARRDVPIFAVGPQTAAAARAAGFTSIKDAQGDALALSDAVQKWATPVKGPLLHVAGEQRAGDLATRLARAGFQVHAEALYRTVSAECLSEEATDALRSGMLDAAMLFSPRSARLFAQCVARDGLEQSCVHLAALCISQATADATVPLAFARMSVAARPNLEAMLALLDEMQNSRNERVGSR